jgi:hypothetical protein
VISESVGLLRSERDTGRTRANNNNNRPTAYLYILIFFFFVDVLPKGNVSYNMIIQTPTGCTHTRYTHTHTRFCVRAAQTGRRGKSVQVKISTSHLCKYRWPEREANKFSHRLCEYIHTTLATPDGGEPTTYYNMICFFFFYVGIPVGCL